jgi:hypothetical protein
MEIEWTVWKCDNNGIKNQDIFIIKPAGYIEIAQKQQKYNYSSTQKTKMRWRQICVLVRD